MTAVARARMTTAARWPPTCGPLRKAITTAPATTEKALETMATRPTPPQTIELLQPAA